MPTSYYTLAANQINIPKGEVIGGVEVQFTDAFFADKKTLDNYYVIPLKMTGVQGADSILQGKAVKLPSLDETIAYANRQMETLWPEYTRLLNPNIMEVNLSDKLQELKSHIIDEDLKKK